MKALKDNTRRAREPRFSTVLPEGSKRNGEIRPATSHNALEETIDLYGIRNWGGEYFDVNRVGEVVLAFEATRGTPVSLKSIIDELHQRGVSTPMVLRFPQILDYQIKKLVGAFKAAIQEFDYRREYVPVYPIKVNQKKEVVQEVLDFGDRYNLGIEVGSKAELTVALALTHAPESPIICNGVKDEAYLKLALMGKQVGKKVFIVLESLFELGVLLELSKRLKIRPLIGLRLKLSARGSGKWEKSSGDLSKFGFTTTDLLKCLDLLGEERLIDCLHLLHFHIGSQVTDIKRVKYAVKEAARTYAKLRKLCANLDYLDVGGGLGIDYDGSRTASESSVNYSVQEYANDIIYSIKEVCESEDVREPIVITENGRMVAAPHAMLIFNVVNELSLSNGPIRVTNLESKPQVIQEMYDLYTRINGKNYREYYHDVVEQRDEMFSLFNLGYLSLEDRGLGQELFWGVCERAIKYAKLAKHMPEEFEDLERRLSRKFICNFSVFQSIPDSWAIDQLFPIIPLHRLDEAPDRTGYLADLTCDSDGKVDNFIDLRDVKESLELHPLNGEPYYLGVFFTGAYQDVMGDYHNLFGNVHDALVVVDGKGSCHITKIVPGHKVEGVLKVFGYEREELLSEFRSRVSEGVTREGLKAEWGNHLMREYEAALGSYTYLTLDK
ncbi:MAG TPA: biosynthetic arginine decarboxylase [Candidatus Binatia bacterium]|nr:biosynthetic arginine decarboxylase [Candidatus Binatia bacterium]